MHSEAHCRLETAASDSPSTPRVQTCTACMRREGTTTLRTGEFIVLSIDSQKTYQQSTPTATMSDEKRSNSLEKRDVELRAPDSK